MEIGVFIPIGNNGWLISTTSPQYTPSFDLNKEIVLRAEKYGFDFCPALCFGNCRTSRSSISSCWGSPCPMTSPHPG